MTGPFVAGRGWPGKCLDGRGGNRFSRDRQEDAENASLAGLARHRHGPVVGARNPQHHRQAEAASGKFAGKKRIEKIFDVVGRDPAAGVLHLQAGVRLVLRLPVDGKMCGCGKDRRRQDEQYDVCRIHG